MPLLFFLARAVMEEGKKFLDKIPDTFNIMRDYNGCPIDEKSLKYLTWPHTCHLRNYLPLKTSQSDNNCLPSAISLLIYGTQDNSDEVRLRILLYMMENQEELLATAIRQRWHTLINNYDDEIVNTANPVGRLGPLALEAGSRCYGIEITMAFPFFPNKPELQQLYKVLNHTYNGEGENDCRNSVKANSKAAVRGLLKMKGISVKFDSNV